MFIHEEAIVLKSSPFEEKAFIIDLFCENSGLLKIFIQGSNPALAPFTKISCVLQKSKSELYYLKEFNLIERLPKERTPAALEISFRLYEALQGTTRDVQIYALYKAFLENIHLAKRPENLLASFLLKLLRHEGFMTVERDPDAYVFADGEWFRREEAPAWGLILSAQEIDDLIFVTTSRSLWDIDEKNFTKSFLMKITKIFENAKGGT
ncbi:MAG: DNA repair protein RecO [Chlamydiota bacterium]